MERLDAIRRRTGAGDRSTLFARTPLPPVACCTPTDLRNHHHNHFTATTTARPRPSSSPRTRIRPHNSHYHRHTCDSLHSAPSATRDTALLPPSSSQLRRRSQFGRATHSLTGASSLHFILWSTRSRLGQTLPAPRETSQSRGHACRTISQDTVNHCADTE